MAFLPQAELLVIACNGRGELCGSMAPKPLREIPAGQSTVRRARSAVPVSLCLSTANPETRALRQIRTFRPRSTQQSVHADLVRDISEDFCSALTSKVSARHFKGMQRTACCEFEPTTGYQSKSHERRPSEHLAEFRAARRHSACSASPTAPQRLPIQGIFTPLGRQSPPPDRKPPVQG
jgi:hypothetical protein